MKNKKQAFTLVELLAVIVILAIILIIAVPNVLNIIEGTKKDSYKNQIKLIENMAEVYAVSKSLTYDDKGVAKITITASNSTRVNPTFLRHLPCLVACLVLHFI